MKASKRLVAIMITAVLVGFMSPAYGEITLAQWGFNEGSGSTAADSSGNGYDGTLMGNATWTTDAQTGASALSLDGDGDYVSVPDPNGEHPGSPLTNPRQDVTLEAWIKPVGTVGRAHVISKYYSYRLEYDRFDTAGTDRFYFTLCVSTAVGGREHLTHIAHMDLGEHLSTTEYSHIKAVYDSNLGIDTMRVYVNDERVVDNNYKKDETRDIFTGNGQQLIVGAYVNASDNVTAHYFDGLIDDAKISMSGAGALGGDANMDRVVDLQDFTILKANYGTGTVWCEGDFNDDGVVDLQDFTILKANYGGTSGMDMNVPEPATIGLFALAGLGLVRRRRK